MSLLDALNAACEDITADHFRGGGGGGGGIFSPGAWQCKTSDVMLMEIFGLNNKSDRISTKNTVFHGCYFVVILYFCVFVVT